MTLIAMKSYFKAVLDLTLAKFQDDNQLYKEYFRLEEVPPAPGQPHRQHANMVKQGLCKQACQHPFKNRYCNLFPFDTNLVKLTTNNKDASEDSYINASWIDLPGARRRYIAAMGPMHPSSYSDKLQPDTDGAEDTIQDFWQMCWQTRSKVIVMLCDIQKGFTGCSPYFPEEEKEVTSGPFTISVTDIKTETHFVERHLNIERQDSVDTQKVVHLQFKSWPNYGVPDEPGPIADFIQMTHALANTSGLEPEATADASPELLVHCSGGIGRTGTFLAAYQTYSNFLELSRQEMIDQSPESISIVDLVWALRTQRHPWMVEGYQQYEMAYKIITHMLKSFAD